MEESIEQFQLNLREKLQQQLLDSIKGMYVKQDQEVLVKISTFQQYLKKQYQIVNENNLTLSQLCPRSDTVDLEEMQKCILEYFSTLTSKSYARDPPRKNRGQISSQFKSNLKKVPSGALIYISIMEIEGDRFHMIVRSARGESLAYFERQRQCKKLQKISLILKCMKKPMMVVIIDQTDTKKADLHSITKTCSQANQFLFIFENAEDVSIKIDSNQLRSSKSKPEPQKVDFIKRNNQLMIFSSNFGSIIDSAIYHTLIGICKKHQKVDNEALCTIRGSIPDEERDMEFEFIFINVLRACQCTPEKAIFIIRDRLFIKKQQNFKQKELMKNQKPQEQVVDRNTKSHHLQMIRSPKVCFNCLLTHGMEKKSQYKCEPCSAKWKIDIALCPDCSKNFHQILLKSKTGRKKISSKIKQMSKRNKQKAGQSKKSQQSYESSQQFSVMQEEVVKIQNPVQIKRQPSINAKILKLEKLSREMFQIINRSQDKKSFLDPLLAFSMEKARKLERLWPVQEGFELTTLAASTVEQAERLFPQLRRQSTMQNQHLVKQENKSEKQEF